MSDGPTVGIDLGTTFSAVSYIDEHGAPKLIANSLGQRTTPSVVFFEEDGKAVVGEVARNQALASPERTVQHIKRSMGDPTFRLSIDGTEWLPEAISAVILKELKSDAEARLGVEIQRAVISVPAYFKDAQRSATRTAGQLAGLEVVATINEPTAAALAYGFGKEEQDQKLLVYDFGGGTFDVTILQKAGREFTVLATDGDSQLGGIDVDALIVGYLAEQFLRQHRVDLRDDPTTRIMLWEQAQSAKLALASRQSVTIALSAGGTAMRVDLSQEGLEDLVGGLVGRTRECMQRALGDSGLDWGAIDAILLVGGSSRLQAVRKMVDAFGRPTPADVRADEAVALGAALRAAMVDVTERNEPAGRSNSTVAVPPEGGLVVHDVASHSLGVRATSGGKPVNSVIIPRLTPLPCERRRLYRTLADSQARFEIDILQGEDPDPFSPNVELVGHVSLADLPPRPAGGVVVAVTLHYDVDGAAEVVAEELEGGVAVRSQLLRKVGALTAEAVQELKSQVASTGRADEDVVDDITRPGNPDPGHDPPVSPSDAGGEADPAFLPDYYALLAIEPDAETEEIGTAIADARSRFESVLDHPTATVEQREDALWALARLADAEPVLLDPDRRAQYNDQLVARRRAPDIEDPSPVNP